MSTSEVPLASVMPSISWPWLSRPHSAAERRLVLGSMAQLAAGSCRRRLRRADRLASCAADGGGGAAGRDRQLRPAVRAGGFGGQVRAGHARGGHAAPGRGRPRRLLLGRRRAGAVADEDLVGRVDGRGGRAGRAGRRCQDGGADGRWRTTSIARVRRTRRRVVGNVIGAIVRGTGRMA